MVSPPNLQLCCMVLPLLEDLSAEDVFLGVAQTLD
jgi:hypothetical protein